MQSPKKEDFISLLNSQELSWKAKGVAIYIITFPGSSGKCLAACGHDGKDSVRGAIKELLSEGLIERRVVRDGGCIVTSGYIWRGWPQ